MIIISSPTTKEQFKAYYSLRYQVLREPWGHPRGTEKDDYEPISEHFMAVDDQAGEVLGVAKLFEKAPGVGDFSHLAIAIDHQRQGQMLVDAIEHRARERGFRTLGTMSRLTTTAFFEKYGYRITGIPAPHLGTIHVVWMEKDLSL
jgi:N-acetylglutamate synthase-like GNAT family acetyltransferase